MNNNNSTSVLILFLSALILVSCASDGDISIVDIPLTETSNSHYASNRAPLKPNVLIKLPVGSIQPGSWLKEILKRQASGLTGNLGRISAWLQKEDNAWLSKDGKGKWGWEEVPYWLKGYANIGYILKDDLMIEESKIWLDAVINSQREDGNFGPVMVSDKDGSQDFWANMIMLYCLQSYYEYSGDERVINLMRNYFKYQLSVPDELFLSRTQYWQRIRGGDNLHSVMWLYNRTGDEWLLELAEKVHRNTAPWSSRGHEPDAVGSWMDIRDGYVLPEWYGDLIDWHNVNVAQAFREPAQYYQLSHDPADLQATYDNFNVVREHYGQVPGGMFGADENARPGYDDPRQGIETCGMVEQMNSNEHLLRITGDLFWAGHTEEVAFNSYPAAMMPDFKSLRYITSPNMIVSDDKNHHPEIQNGGPMLMMNPFSSRCCQHNHTQGWPYFSENLWMATQDNGLAAVIYSAGTVSAKVGNGEEISITCESNYPFEDKLTFTVQSGKAVECPLYFAIPSWCGSAEVLLNGESISVSPEAGKYVRINRTWKSGDIIILNLPKTITVHTWEKNHNSVSVNYGPLTFSLRIGETYLRKESTETAIRDSRWQKGADVREWPSYEIRSTTKWNYGLVLDKADLADNFTIVTKEWPKDNYPFTFRAAPIVMKAKAKIIPGWVAGKTGLVGELQDSPVISWEFAEPVELIPMGAARLRISAFPVIGAGPDANVWK